MNKRNARLDSFRQIRLTGKINWRSVSLPFDPGSPTFGHLFCFPTSLNGDVNVITTIRFALLGRCQKGPRQKMIPSVNSTTNEQKILPKMYGLD
jgi:hypothetical protein